MNISQLEMPPLFQFLFYFLFGVTIIYTIRHKDETVALQQVCKTV